MPGTEGADVLFWSPDSQTVAFFAGSKLKRIDIAGGAPQLICEAPVALSAEGASWSRDGVIVFAGVDGLFRVPSSGGVVQRLTELDAARKEMTHGEPQFLPDGKRFLYLIQSADPNFGGIYSGSLDNPKQRVLILANAIRKAYYAPPRHGSAGYLLWLREQTLLAQPFDQASLRLEGNPIPVAEQVTLGPFPRIAFWVSDEGILAYRTRTFENARLVWFSRDGAKLGQAGKEDRYGTLRLSPDGERVAVSRPDDGGKPDIWILQFDRNVMTRLTFNDGWDSTPVWSPDGRQIAFYSVRNSEMLILRKDARGAGQEEALVNTSRLLPTPNDWSRDGLRLIFSKRNQTDGSYDLWLLPLQGDRTPLPVLATPYLEGNARFSPDSKWIAYESDESGRSEVYVRALSNSGGQWQVSAEGGTEPKWRGDAKELYYLGPEGDSIMAAEVIAAGVGFRTDRARELFPIAVPQHAGEPGVFDVTADGQRFLVKQPASGAAQRTLSLVVVTDWQAALER